MSNEALTPQMMEAMLEEIAAYSIDLEEDPTLPTLGLAYLQRVVAQCRSFSNRVQFYMQKVKRYEIRLRSELKLLELDLEMKMAEKLADDQLVRKQSSIEDRRAVAMTMLAAEHKQIAEIKVQIQDVEETHKIIKMKHQELLRTSSDIKTQRNLVKDDMLARLGGHEGYLKPQTGKDRGVPDGLPPPVSARIDPVDILETAPAAKQMAGPASDRSAISSFLNGEPAQKKDLIDALEDGTIGSIPGLGEFFDSSLKPDPMVERAKEQLRQAEIRAAEERAFVSSPTGTKCSVCKAPQFTTPGGNSCPNGHGGASPLAEDSDSAVATGPTVSYEDLLI